MTTLSDNRSSPMMLQWQACKKKAEGAIVLFRLGDFYEAFEEDALLLSKELDLTLTKRQETPMCGAPAHTVETYIDKIVGLGYRVAIVEQMEDPKLVKGIVKRDIVRIVTPGTLITSSLLADKRNNFIVSLSCLNGVFGLAILDLTTADFRVMELENAKKLQDELYRLNPSEILLSKKCKKLLSLEPICSMNEKEDWYFDPQICADTLLRHFKIHSLDGFGLKGMNAAINAAGALFSYVKEELNLSLNHVKTITLQQNTAFMALSHTTQRHLELLEPLNEGKKEHTLLYHLDHTQTPMGGRLLKQWISYPLLSVQAIHQRQEAILAFQSTSVSELSSLLTTIRDLERLMMRIQSGYASPKDIVALRYSLEPVPEIAKLLKNIPAELIQGDVENLKDVSEVTSLIQEALVDNPPFRLSDGGAFREGYNQALDELALLRADSHSWIANYQAELRERTQIKTLKVGFTRAFGYYIEVSRVAAGKIPETFQRRQTLVNAERFITPELKEYEHKMQTAEQRISLIEIELFTKLREKIASYSEKVLLIAGAVARLDCLFSLSVVAKKYQYVKPEVNETGEIHIQGGRHPVIEASLLGNAFIPNDVLLDTNQNKLILLTGPNMAGKSTYIRQVALLVIMAQIGCFIPAETARIGVVDKVFTRIGASDDLSRGQSTFMVEMAEAANILHNATASSLIILDEIGRGTSTYDGIAIAWAVAEYLLTHKEKGGKTLFATHYWELTELEGKMPGAVNYHVAVHEGEDGIIFLRKILKGSTDKSYGIHVAKLAGLPTEVIKKANEMLKSLESKKEVKKEKPKELTLFSSKQEIFQSAIETELKNIDPNTLTPIEALQKLIAWKKTYGL